MAAEDRQTVVGHLNSVKRFARLREVANFLRRHIEVASGLGLLERDVDAAEEGAVHAAESLEIPPASITAMFISVPCACALASAAATTFWAWAK